MLISGLSVSGRHKASVASQFLALLAWIVSPKSPTGCLRTVRLTWLSADWPNRHVATVQCMTIQRLENVGIVVDDLAAATAFFVEL